MTEIGDRYRNVAADFTARVDNLPEGRWDDPAPCDGWVARDVVGHLAEWVPAMFFANAGVAVEVPPVDEDPAATWHTLDEALQRLLDDDELVAKEVEFGMGPMPLGQAFTMFGLGDVLVHTWDLARATGQPETLDAGEVEALYAQMTKFPEEQMRSSGMFGPRVEVPEDADIQTKLLAYSGRQP